MDVWGGKRLWNNFEKNKEDDEMIKINLIYGIYLYIYIIKMKLKIIFVNIFFVNYWFFL